MYTHSLTAKKMLTDMSATPTVSTSGVKLPKINILSFNGNILNWRSFWEQFNVAIHSHTMLSNTEKLTYLQSSIKDIPAKTTIDGLSQSGNNYQEAIDTLKARYVRPCLVHQAHVWLIVEAPGLWEGSGHKLHCTQARIHSRRSSPVKFNNY